MDAPETIRTLDTCQQRAHDRESCCQQLPIWYFSTLKILSLLTKRSRARAKVINAFKTLNWGKKTRAYRINDLETEYAYQDIISVVEEAGEYIDVIIVPKVKSAKDVWWVDVLLTQIEKRLKLPHRIGLEVLIEEVEAIVNIEEIALASPRLEALIFGPGDYSASQGMDSRVIEGQLLTIQVIPGTMCATKSPLPLALRILMLSMGHMLTSKILMAIVASLRMLAFWALVASGLFIPARSTLQTRYSLQHRRRLPMLVVLMPPIPKLRRQGIGAIAFEGKDGRCCYCEKCTQYSAESRSYRDVDACLFFMTSW